MRRTARWGVNEAKDADCEGSRENGVGGKWREEERKETDENIRGLEEKQVRETELEAKREISRPH